MQSACQDMQLPIQLHKAICTTRVTPINDLRKSKKVDIMLTTSSHDFIHTTQAPFTLQTRIHHLFSQQIQIDATPIPQDNTGTYSKQRIPCFHTLANTSQDVAIIILEPKHLLRS